MDLTDSILEFKESRSNTKKSALNVTISEERLQKLLKSVSSNSKFFMMLGRSEQVDFLLYMLERFMKNSPDFNYE